MADEEHIHQFGENIAREVSARISSGSIKCSHFGGKAGEDIVSWLEEYEYATRAANWTDEHKLFRLPLFLIGAAISTYNLDIARTEDMKWEDAKKILIKQFCPISYRTHIRQLLRNKRQRPFEPVSSYISEMRELCYKFDQEMKSEDILQYIVEGMLPLIAQQEAVFNLKTIKELQEKAVVVEQSFKVAQGIEQISINNVTIPDKQTDQMKELRKMIEEIKETVQTKKTFQPSNFSRNLNVNPRCYYCKRVGHTKYNCNLLKQKYEISNNGQRTMNQNWNPTNNQQHQTIPKQQFSNHQNNNRNRQQNTNFTPREIPSQANTAATINSNKTYR